MLGVTLYIKKYFATLKHPSIAASPITPLDLSIFLKSMYKSPLSLNVNIISFYDIFTFSHIIIAQEKAVLKAKKRTLHKENFFNHYNLCYFLESVVPYLKEKYDKPYYSTES